LLVDWFRIDDSRTGGSFNIATVGRDLRAQKKAELELRHLNETLENRVIQRTLELADANEKSQAEMFEHKQLESRPRVAHLELGHAARFSTAGQMAAALAHELNQPLTAIVNSLVPPSACWRVAPSSESTRLKRRWMKLCSTCASARR
jgi:phosphoglycerate-specific signal transduction histidine kinase